MSRKHKTASVSQPCPPKRNRESSEESSDDDDEDFVSMEMLQQAVFEDDFMYLEDNLDRYIQQQNQRIGESKIEEELFKKTLKGGAPNCLAVLQNSPYNKKHRCIHDLFVAFDDEDIWKVESILTKIPKRFINLQYEEDYCSVTSLLLRPLDVAYGMEHAHIVREMSRRKRRNSRSTSMTELGKLFFELILSTPALWEQLDDMEELDAKHWCLLALSQEERRDHLQECIGFPQCLFQPHMSSILCDTSNSLFPAFKLWMSHRFQSKMNRAKMDPPSLLVCCRIRVRSWLISLQDRQRKCPNYLVLVNRLPLSQKLRDFLLFKELWPSDSVRFYSSDEDSPLDDLEGASDECI